jgi:hypothetical protein
MLLNIYGDDVDDDDDFYYSDVTEYLQQKLASWITSCDILMNINKLIAVCLLSTILNDHAHARKLCTFSEEENVGKSL